MAVVERIRAALAHAVQERCEERGCECRLGRPERCVILKGELVRRDQRMCDCIIFCAGGVLGIFLVELKGRTLEPDEVREKLQNSAVVALGIVEKYGGRQVRYEVRCLVLSKGWHSSAFKVITKRRVRIGGKRVPIEPHKCGFCIIG